MAGTVKLTDERSVWEEEASRDGIDQRQEAKRVMNGSLTQAVGLNWIFAVWWRSVVAAVGIGEI
jgi:hypothetical protein